MWGVLVNAVGILIGGILGSVCGNLIPKKLEETIMNGVGLCVVYIGFSGTLAGENSLVLVLSIVFGGVLGTLADIDGALERLGKWVEKKLSPGKEGGIAKGLVTASLIFCIGAMAIVGSINAGLEKNYSTLYTKTLLDTITSMTLASTLGIGVALSAVSVFLYQGAICLLAGYVGAFLNAFPAGKNELICAGSLLILALGLNMLGLTKIKIANYLPAVIIAPILCIFM